MQAQDVIDAVRRMGSDPRDLRDAAHEAHHALRAGVKPGRWGRETIHAALVRVCRRSAARLLVEEIDARAVEQVVCKRLGVDAGSLEHWSLIACMEGIETGIAMPDPDAFSGAVWRQMRAPEIARAADAVLALVEVPTKACLRRSVHSRRQWTIRAPHHR